MNVTVGAGSRASAGREGLLGASGECGAAAGEPPSRRDVLPANEALRPPLLPLPGHRELR